MGVLERAKNRGLQLVGRAKQWFGEARGDRWKVVEGRRDRVVGGLRVAADEVRDWAATAARDARRRFSNHSPRTR
jgi:uncharacterized protein YjbJ (UPF0337 family)